MDQELKKDVIIGVVDNYGWDKIKYWEIGRAHV